MRILMQAVTLISLLVINVSCRKDNRSQPTVNPLAEVQAKRDLYVSLAKEQVDEYGWLTPKCDGLLFNSLAAYSGFPVNPLMAEKEAGLWHRHPSFSCYPDESKSTISKDMFRGLFLYLLQQKDRASIQRIKDYCDSHEILLGSSCAMGEAVDEESYYGRVVFNPTQRSQINRMLGLSLTSKTAKDDFEAHLDVLRIYTDYKIDGGLSDDDVKALHNYAEASPRNALFQILASKFGANGGDQSQAIATLLDEVLFPADRLPNDTDHYTHYLWQRDDNEDWLPCGSSDKRPCENVTHSGVDLMFAVKLLEE